MGETIEAGGAPGAPADKSRLGGFRLSMLLSVGTADHLLDDSLLFASRLTPRVVTSSCGSAPTCRTGSSPH